MSTVGCCVGGCEVGGLLHPAARLCRIKSVVPYRFAQKAQHFHIVGTAGVLRLSPFFDVGSALLQGSCSCCSFFLFNVLPERVVTYLKDQA